MSQDRWGFNHWAQSYDEDILNASRAGDWIFKDYNRVLDKVIEYCELEPNGYSSGLDIGVGTGNLAARLLSRGIQVIGIDPSEEMREICRRKYPDMMVVDGDFLKISSSLPRVDLIVSTYAFHHLTTAEKAVSIPVMKRFLKQKGRIVIADLMFRNVAEESGIKRALQGAGRTDILDEFKDEYPGLFDELKRVFSGEGFSFRGEKLTESVWILGASL